MKRWTGALILIVISAALVAGLACYPGVSSARQDEDWYIINADGRSGKIIGTEMGYDPTIMNALLSKPYFSTAKIVYSDGTSYVMGGIYEIGIAENADLIESIKALKTLLGNKSAIFKVERYSYSQLMDIENEIQSAIDSLSKAKTPETEKYSVPGVKEALQAILSCDASYSDNCVEIWMNWPYEESAEIINRLFPYGCLVFKTPAGVFCARQVCSTKVWHVNFTAIASAITTATDMLF